MNRLGHYGGAKLLHAVWVRARLPERSAAADAVILTSSLVCSAFLMAVAVGPRGHPWIGWVGLLPVFLAIRALSPPRAMLCGALWGFCLHVFSVFGAGAAISLAIGSLGFLVSLPAIYAYLGARLTRRIGFSPLFLAFGWVGLEFALRPVGLGHGLLAGTQGDGGIIHAVGGPLGYLFAAFLIAFVNAKLLSIVNDARFKRGRSSLLSSSDETRAWILPQSSSRLLLLVEDSFQPRAPPKSVVAMSWNVVGNAHPTRL